MRRVPGALVRNQNPKAGVLARIRCTLCRPYFKRFALLMLEACKAEQVGDIANIGIAAIMRGKPPVDVFHRREVIGGLNCEEALGDGRAMSQ